LTERRCHGCLLLTALEARKIKKNYEERYAMERFGVTRQQAREIDDISINRYGIDGLILMENAGLGCVREIENMLQGVVKGRKAVILCGKGNNGGDGFVIARHLVNRGADVRCSIVGEIDGILSQDSDAAVNLNIVLNMGIPVREITVERDVENVEGDIDSADMVVDALLGTGARGEVRGLFRPLIELLNGKDVPVLSVDVPSGLDCDTGQPMGMAVRASRTVTFVMPKAGYANPEAATYTGTVKVADISVPVRLIEEKLREWQGVK
jgi:NAD(P)H-hydrate epimerase